MKKKLLALAVAGAIAPAVAMADASSVTLYGTLNADFENVKAGDDVARRNRVSSNSSNFGIRGSEDLGGGLKAIFQIESAIGIDGSTSTLAGRNTNLGLTGNWGTAFLGQWDTPYKSSTLRLDPFGDTTIAGYTNVLGGNATQSANNAAFRNSFDRRQRNSVQYWTPNFAGFTARAAYSANEERNTAAACGAGVSCNPRLWSVSLAYENGPLYLTGAYERHDDYANSLTQDTKDTGWKLGAAYTFLGAHTVGLVFERLEFEGNLAALPLPKVATNPGGGNDAELDTWFASYQGKFGPHIVRATYGQNRDIEVGGRDQSETKAHFWALGYGYALSKRTELYALYTRIKNEENSANDFAVNALGGVGPGSIPTGYGVGIRHTF